MDKDHESGPPVSEAEILRKINLVENYIQEHKNVLPERFYEAINGISRTALAYKDTNGKSGWAKNIRSEIDNQALWKDEEADTLEELISSIINKTQTGVDPRSQPDTSSIDKRFENISNKITEIDTKNREILSVIGPIAIIKAKTNNFQNNYDTLIPNPFDTFIVKLSVPQNSIISIIQTVLETCRMIVTNSDFDVELYQKLLSIVIGLFDISRGEWKDGILNLLYFFNMDLMNIGKKLKMMQCIYNFISPDIQICLEDDTYLENKTIFIGGFLWFISIVSPLTVRVTINKLLNLVTNNNIPLDDVGSFEDIQKFQSLVHTTEIFCSYEFQEVLSHAILTPALRLCLELMNIITIPEKIIEKCKKHTGKISETLVESSKPSDINIGGSLLTNFIENSMGDNINLKPAENSVERARKNVWKTAISVSKNGVNIFDDLKKNIVPIISAVSDNNTQTHENQDKLKKNKNKTRKARRLLS